MNRLSILVTSIAIAVVAASCGGGDPSPAVERSAADADSSSTSAVELDPLTAFEWDLVGTWRLDTADDPDRVTLFEAVGTECDLQADHTATCRDAEGAVSRTGLWLADPIDGSAGQLRFVNERSVLSFGVDVDGSSVVQSSGFDDATWVRVGELDRGARPEPTDLNPLELELVGTWTADATDARLGRTCTFAADRTLSCDGVADATWRALRGLPNLAAHLSVNTGSGGWGDGVRLDGDTMTIGSGPTWTRSG